MNMLCVLFVRERGKMNQRDIERVIWGYLLADAHAIDLSEGFLDMLAETWAEEKEGREAYGRGANYHKRNLSDAMMGRLAKAQDKVAEQLSKKAGYFG